MPRKPIVHRIGRCAPEQSRERDDPARRVADEVARVQIDPNPKHGVGHAEVQRAPARSKGAGIFGGNGLVERHRRRGIFEDLDAVRERQRVPRVRPMAVTGAGKYSEHPPEGGERQALQSTRVKHTSSDPHYGLLRRGCAGVHSSVNAAQLPRVDHHDHAIGCRAHPARARRLRARVPAFPEWLPRRDQ